MYVSKGVLNVTYIIFKAYFKEQESLKIYKIGVQQQQKARKKQESKSKFSWKNWS